MADQNSKVMVVGGTSRIGTALINRLGDSAFGVVRRDSPEVRDIRVEDYDAIPLSAFDGVTCVVNCVGTNVGRADELDRANRIIPASITASAKQAAVRHLIHISSFSVYGRARAVDRHTATRSETPYGHSKLAGDAALLALADDAFAVTILRLPLIYGAESAGKLGRLLRWWSRIGVMPVPAGDISRAMISVDLSAAVIAARIADRRTGVVFAADPRPFTYADAALARPARLRQLPIPAAVAKATELLMPAIGSRLFADSRLADDDNLAMSYGLASQLYHDIAAMPLDARQPSQSR